MARTRIKGKSFTLVEILVALGTFMLMTVMLMEFFSAAQQTWSLTDRNTRIYENARVAFDLIARDLRGAVTSDVPGDEIPFYYNCTPSNPYVGYDYKNTSGKVGFVTASASSQGKSRLCEVYYEVDGNDRLLRYVVDEDESSPTPPSSAISPSPWHWDFYGKTGDGWLPDASTAASGKCVPDDDPDDPADDWAKNDEDAVIIRGVEHLEFECRDASGSLTGTGVRTDLPAYVDVTLKVFDPDLAKEDVPAKKRQNQMEKSLRTFRKRIYLGN